MTNKNKLFVTCLGVLAAATQAVSAASVTLDHHDRGGALSTNALTGSFFDGAWQNRIIDLNNVNPALPDGTPQALSASYTVFDLANVSGTVESASFRIYAALSQEATPISYSSGNASETFALWDVDEVNDLINKTTTTYTHPLLGVSMSDVFDDITGGTMYGSVEVDSDDDGTYVEVTLSQDAIDEINTQIGQGYFAVGGSLVNTDNNFGADDTKRLFKGGYEGTTQTTQLVLNGTNVASVPEPSSAALLALGGVAAFMRRKRG